MRPAAVAALALASGLVWPALSSHTGEPGASSVSGRGRVATHYLLHCSGCHGPDARGTPGVTPSLHGLAAVADAPGGRGYLMRVPGVAQAPLDDEDLAVLLDWVVAYFSDQPVRRRFDPVDVGRWRADPLRDPVAARAALGQGDPGDRASTAGPRSGSGEDGSADGR